MKGWLQVFRKEIKEFTRDRRLLASALLGPVLLEALLIMLFGYLEQTLGEERAQKVLVVNRTEGQPVLGLLKDNSKFDFRDLPIGTQADAALKERKARLVLQFPKGFAKDFTDQKAPKFTAFVDPNETTSQITLQALKSELANDVQRISKQRMAQRKLDPRNFVPFQIEERQAKTGKPFAGAWLVGFLPYLIVIWAFYGGFSIVSDLVAGEKERGSLETLLIAPISRTAIAIGKFCALASLSLLSCISALFGVVLIGLLNLPATRELFKEGLTMSPLSVLAIAATLIPLVVFFAGSLLAISTFARNQREVQGYLSLLSFVVLVPAIMSQFIGFTEAATARWVAFVPVLNTATVIREALLDKVEWYSLLVTAGVNTFIAAVGLWYAIRLFSKESVLLRV